MNRKVVITGIGLVTAIGRGKESFFKALLNKETNFHHLPKFYHRGYKYKTKYYVPAPESKTAAGT